MATTVYQSSNLKICSRAYAFGSIPNIKSIAIYETKKSKSALEGSNWMIEKHQYIRRWPELCKMFFLKKKIIVVEESSCMNSASYDYKTSQPVVVQHSNL